LALWSALAIVSLGQQPGTSPAVALRVTNCTTALGPKENKPMKKSSLLDLSLLLFACFLATAAYRDKPGSSQGVVLRVTFEPVTACGICSDGLGEYVDGVDGVSANFSKYGFLYVDFSAARPVTFDYSYPGNPPPPPALPVVTPKITTYKAFDPFTNPQDMSFGMTQCLPLGWSYNNGNTARNLGFEFGPHVGGSSYAIITCTAAANPDNTGQCIQWSLEPKADGTCNPLASLAGVTDTVTGKGNKLTYYDRGLYTMPFKLTLRRK
jgi:hypothetical protein